MFTTEEELRELTGLSHDELWEHDFNLDDWDVGFQCDEILHHIGGDGYEYGDYKETWIEPNEGCDWLVNSMDQYCVGFHYTEYNGKHYYTVHHS